MKKTITIYELLGLIKDNKAPKKIRIRDTYTCILTYDERMKDYDVDGNYYMLKDIISYRTPDDFLNDNVEILDEEEFEDIEKLDIEDNAMNRSERYIRKSNNEFVTLSVSDYVLANKINQLIKNQKKIIERLK